MKKLITQLALVTAALFSANSFAGDYSHYESLGFSADGRYYAFLQDGYHDGSGFYFVEVDVVDVEENRLLRRVYSNTEQEFMPDDESTDDWEEFERNQEEYGKRLRKIVLDRVSIEDFGIDGNTQGNLLLSRPGTDFSTYTDTKFSTYINAFGGTIPTPEIFELNITSTRLDDEEVNEWCWAGAYLLKMTVGREDYDGNARVVTLQDDKRLPKSRQCAFDYSIKAVYELNNRIVVQVQYKSTGFEGPNYINMVVTGNLNKLNQH